MLYSFMVTWVFVHICRERHTVQCTKKEKSKLEFFLSFFIHHFHIDHNASCLLPNMMHNHCLRFLLELLLYPGGIKIQNLGGLIRCIMVYLKIVNNRERANPALSQIKLYR